MSFRRLFGRCKQPPGHKEMGKAKRTAVQDPNAKRQEKSVGRVTECCCSQNCVFAGCEQ